MKLLLFRSNRLKFKTQNPNPIQVQTNNVFGFNHGNMQQVIISQAHATLSLGSGATTGPDTGHVVHCKRASGVGTAPSLSVSQHRMSSCWGNSQVYIR